MKRRNYSPHTVKNYLNLLKGFVVWVDVPIEEVTRKKMAAYIDYLLAKGLAPKTINCSLISIRGFYDYLTSEEANSPTRSGQAPFCGCPDHCHGI